ARDRVLRRPGLGGDDGRGGAGFPARLSPDGAGWTRRAPAAGAVILLACPALRPADRGVRDRPRQVRRARRIEVVRLRLAGDGAKPCRPRPARDRTPATAAAVRLRRAAAPAGAEFGAPRGLTA